MQGITVRPEEFLANNEKMCSALSTHAPRKVDASAGYTDGLDEPCRGRWLSIG